jgi:hypothetical protein
MGILGYRSYNLSLEEPNHSDPAIHHLVDRNSGEIGIRQSSDAFVVGHDASGNDTVYQFGVKLRNCESVLGVMLTKCLLAREHWFLGRWPKDLDIVGVLGDEALKITGVVGVELALNGVFWSGHGSILRHGCVCTTQHP